MKVLRNQLVLPLNFEILIDENDPVWKMAEICDTLDYTFVRRISQALAND